jgi:serine/threonine protein kinase/DNA-binding XRE family transcriptional regulator
MLDLTQDKLAQRVGCSVVTTRKFETDERRPSKQIAERLMDVLSIPRAEHSTFIRLARGTPRTEAPALPKIPPLLTSSPPATAADAGRVVKGYVLCELIGEGGFGVVYRAEQPMLGRDVAVKVILPQYANHPDFIRRFEAEAQLVARLEHPHIVPLYDYWREPDRAYLVMRYVRGGNLQATLQPGPLPLDAVARLLEQIGPALALAHRHGVIHRDLKPTNILLDTDGNGYVADFGIAKDLGAASPTDATQPELILGSPAYLSPEQIKDEPITPQTDIYSLGVLLYESLSGVPPFQSPTPAGLIQKHLSEPLPLLGQQRPDLPTVLDAVLQKATAKQPAERCPDVLSLVGAFQGAAGSGRAIADHEPVPTDQRTPPAVAEPPTLANPYKGLRAFAEADAADFFGRAVLTQRLLERLAEEHALARFLAVVGPSGSGKSSVVRAGLLPAVRRGGWGPKDPAWSFGLQRGALALKSARTPM